MFWVPLCCHAQALQPAAGQSGTADRSTDKETLTFERALQLAERNSPQLRVAAALRQGADAAVVTARAYPNPEFNTLAGPQYRRLPSAEPGLLQHYSVSQPLDLPSVRRARIGAAQIGQESTIFGLEEARLNVRANVKQAFYQVLRRRAEVELARENLRLVEDLRRRIQVQVQEGEAARLELTRAEAEVATATTFANSAQLRLVTAATALQTAMGVPLGPNVEVAGSLETGQRMPALDELLKEVLNRHPGLAQARTEIRRARARLDTEQALRKPQPALRAEYESQPDLGFFRFGITIPLPVWNQRQGPISEAVAAVAQTRALADLRRLELTAAVEQAYGLYEVASQQVLSFERGVLREAEAALRAAEAAFRFGERGIIEVLDAQRVLRNVRLDFINAQYDLQAALIELERLRAQNPAVRP